MNRYRTFLAVMLLLILAVPLFGIAILSFSPTYGMDIFTTLRPSLRWWQELWFDDSWGIALISSTLMGCGSALVAIGVTLPAALAWRLEGSSTARNALLLAALSLTFPPVVMAVGLYRTIIKAGLFDTAVGLALAHLSFTVPICAVVLGARFRTTPTDLYLTAKSLGAGKVSSSIRWLLATQRMTLLGCFAAAVLTSISEVTVALYVTDLAVPTIARRALTGVTRDLKPTGFAALTAWAIILYFLISLVMNRLSRRRATV